MRLKRLTLFLRTLTFRDFRGGRRQINIEKLAPLGGISCLCETEIHNQHEARRVAWRCVANIQHGTQLVWLRPVVFDMSLMKMLHANLHHLVGYGYDVYLACREGDEGLVALGALLGYQRAVCGVYADALALGGACDA